MVTTINVSGTSTTVTGLSQNTTYYYTITPMNQTAAGPTSAVQSATTATVGQATPIKIGSGVHLLTLNGQVVVVATGTSSNHILNSTGGQILLSNGSILANNSQTTNAESAQGTTVTTANGVIYDAVSEAFTIVSGQVAVNGVVDTTTSSVVSLLYWNHNVYQQNSANQWYFKSSASNSWNGPTTDPRGIVITAKPRKPVTSINATLSTESSQGATVTTVGPVLTNSVGEKWGINASGQVTVNSTADTTTSSVILLLYYNHLVYQENNVGGWYYKSKASDNWSAQTTDPRQTGSGVQAKSADAFVESIAINGAWSFQLPNPQTGLAVHMDSGIRHIRGDVGFYDRSSTGFSYSQTKTTANPNGIRQMVELGYGDQQGIVDKINQILADQPGCITIIEGVNEPDGNMAAAAAAQQSFFNDAKGTAAGNLILSTSPTAGAPATDLINAGFSGYYNAISGHCGYLEHCPELSGNLASQDAQFFAPLQTGNLPKYITEAGIGSVNNENGKGDDAGQPAYSWTTETYWLPREFMYYWANGYAKVYKYCMFWNNSQNGTDTDYPITKFGGDQHFGNPPSPPFNLSQVKPIYFTLKNLVQLVGDPPASAGVDTFSPGRLVYTLSGATFSGPTGIASDTSGSNWSVYHTLMSKRNGNFILCFWQYQTNNNSLNRGSNFPSNVNVTINLSGSGMGHYQTATLTTNATMNTFSTATTISNNSVTISVSDALTFLQLSA